jgi:hypothetical protein
MARIAVEDDRDAGHPGSLAQRFHEAPTTFHVSACRWRLAVAKMRASGRPGEGDRILPTRSLVS